MGCRNRDDLKEGLEGRDALAIKLSSGQVHEAAGQVHAPVGQAGWFSYGGTARVVLVAVAAGSAIAAFVVCFSIYVHQLVQET